jgi:CheY-like chemotaxis protein
MNDASTSRGRVRPPANVLVVDDDDAVRTSTAELLRSAGHSVVEARDGDEALKLLHHSEVDVLILDIRMPKFDGVAVCEAMDDPPPVILLSALGLDHASRSRVDGKVFHQAQKPVAPLDLIALVGRALL